jgi:hypothetical protein
VVSAAEASTTAALIAMATSIVVVEVAHLVTIG